MSADVLPPELKGEVQSLALTGFDDMCVRHLLLQVRHPDQARSFIGELVNGNLLAFGERDRPGEVAACKVNLGFSHEGIVALGAPTALLAHLKDKSPAFCEGAVRRASQRLGDTGASAPDRWNLVFQTDRAHTWISIHGPTAERIDECVAAMRSIPSSAGLDGWDDPGLRGEHIVEMRGLKQVKKVHFGFRDGITKPRIDGQKHSPRPGELLMGYLNNDKVDLWTSPQETSAELSEFLRHGSFGVLRQIRQFELALDTFLRERAGDLKDKHPWIAPDYLKAKMCGRWPDGQPVVPPGQSPSPIQDESQLQAIDFKKDPEGLGCPFGAHIRRANPRTDEIVPKDLSIHTLFRRGVPYGRPVDLEKERLQNSEVDRGLLGVFFCARIEDQFERLISEWIEKNPMGPPNRGRSKDPLAGQHDEPDAAFIIPLPDRDPIELKGFQSFVQTRGTLYAIFPSQQALRAMSGWSQDTVEPQAHAQEQPKVSAPAQRQSAAAKVPPGAAAMAAHTAAPSAGPAADPVDPDFMDVPTDRFCDVVMEGGITSGVIYASAAVELGRHYRIRNIGGSSIGAFAAALAAAAEFRRRNGSGEGFERFGELPQKLAETDDGKTLLERLFVPSNKTRRLFSIFHASLERSSVASLLFHGLGAALSQYRRPVFWTTFLLLALTLAGPASTLATCAWGSAVPSCLFGFGSWAMALLLAALVGIVSALLASIAWDLAHGLVPNGFGLCRGWSPDSNITTVDLAAYLHGAIQEVAGRHPIDDPPLTFQDLWDAPGAAAQAMGFKVHGADAARSINLEVYASNLAHSRPYRFPLEETEDMGRLFFRTEQMEEYFPRGIVQYMRAFAKSYEERSEADPSKELIGPGYFELPVGQMPVVVAVRLAMSFPLLISAVPLHAIDHARRSMQPCWMSDGGLCSNFPIHLFDSFVPKWPTFGISLQMRHEQSKSDSTSNVWLPEFHTSGRGEIWDRGPTDSRSGLGKVGAFLVSLWKTTWRWNDNTMMRMPGVRDRVVRVYLEKDEGGVNIRMKSDKIKRLSDRYGKAAAKAFIEKFETPDSVGWQEHRWVRFCCMTLSLRNRVMGIGEAIRLDRHTIPMEEQIEQALKVKPLSKPDRRDRIWPSETPLTPEQAKELQDQLDALCALEDAFEGAGDHKPYRAIPRPNMRIRHPT